MKARSGLLGAAALGVLLSVLAAACGDVHADLITGSGASATRCATDAECASPTPRCDPSSGSCVQCRGVGFVADCPSGMVCAQPSGTCVTACKDPEACSSRVCDGTTGLCGACDDDRDCPGSHPRCDSAAGSCVECLSGPCADPDRPFCVNGACIECVRDGDCDGEERCSSELGECAVPCPNGGECPSSDDPVCHPALFFCVECVEDADCGGVPCRKWECQR